MDHFTVTQRTIASGTVWRHVRGARLLALAGAAVSCFAIVQTAWSAPDANANDGGSGESACDEGGGGDCPPENASANDAVDSGEGEIGQDEDDCNKNAGASASGLAVVPDSPSHVRPVNWETGEKWETITDLIVRLPGMDFRLTRQYTSDPARSGNPYDTSGDLPACVDDDQISANVGAGWGWSNLRAATGRAHWVSGGQQYYYKVQTVDLTIYRPNRKNRHIKGAPGGALSISGPGNQQAGGNFFEDEVEDLHGAPSPCEYMPDAIYYEEPGRWRQTFDLVGGAGWIYRDEDENGNTRLYVDTNNDARALPDLILLNGENTTWNDPDQAQAWIQLLWDDNRLVRADVYRPGASGGIRTQSAIYYHLVEEEEDLVVKYHDGTSYTTLDMPGGSIPVMPHPDLGVAGDLVMVVQEAGTAPGETWNEWRKRVTQYRYHDGTMPSSTGDIRLRVGGAEHQLKSVYLPQQIEAMSQNRSSAMSPNDETVYEMAIGLLELADSDEYAGTGSPQLYTVANKIVSYEGAPDFRVDWQFIQSGSCGCGSGGSVGAVAMSYEWPAPWTTPYPSLSHNGQSMHTREYLLSSFSDWPATVYRSTAHDLLYLKNGSNEHPYLWKKALFSGDIPEELTTAAWVWTREYGTSRALEIMGQPSSVASYTPTKIGAAPESVNGSSGLITAFTYSGENPGTISVGPDGGLDIVESNTYVSSSSAARKGLLASSQRRRVAGSSSPNDVELVTYAYGYDGSGAKLNWRKISVERELESENGHSASATTADSWEFFDDRGQRILTVDPEGLVIRYEYDALTGTVVRVTRNYNPGGSPLNWSAVPELEDYSTTGALPTAANADGARVTEYERDRMGRVVKVTRPGGVESWTLRKMLEDPARPGILHFAVVNLPHEVTTSPNTYAGPARFRWMDAASQTTRTESWSLSTSASYDPDADTYTLDDELSRTVITQSLNGSVTSTESWWNIADDLSFETTYAYDPLGRTTSVVDGTGTQSARLYDIFDRVLETTTGRVGLSSGQGDLVTTAKFYYDGDPGSSPSQGVGNGNLTHIERFDGSGTRTTRMYYDDRDRLIATVAEDAPMSVTRYDNQDRPIESAVYPEPTSVPSLSDVKTAVESALPDDGQSDFSQSAALPRGWHTLTHYSQRGLVYRTEVSIEPDNDAADYLAWNWWFDADGLAIASWAPNSPGTITEYDIHHRVVRSVLTDRGGDGTAALGSASRYAAATGTTGDRVIEQTEYTYDTTSGVLNMVAHRMRHHAKTSTGDPADADFITTYTGRIYDSARRPVASIDFGTNKSAFGTTAASAPTLSSFDTLAELRSATDVLFSWTEYDARGRVGATVTMQSGTSAPDEIRTRYLYDDLGRTAAVIENATSATVSWNTMSGRYAVSGLSFADPDQDRVTSFVYDAAGNVTKRVAHLPVSGGGEKIQETKYVYGTKLVSTPGATDSLVASGRLLREVHYPDETAGTAGATAEYKVFYAYNRLGELRAVTDQNGTVRTLARDAQGRVAADIVETLGTYDVAGSSRTVEGSVRRLGYAYDALGRLTNAISYTDTAATTVRDEVELAYTPLWQIATIAQQHDGVVNGSSPVVEYAYINAAPNAASSHYHKGNYSRLSSIIYPSDSTATVQYTYTAGTDDQISRVTSIQVDDMDPSDPADPGWADIAVYERIGMNMTAKVTTSPPSTGTFQPVLDRTRNLEGDQTDSGNSYPAYDRFGRVTNHMWVRDDYSGTAGTHPNTPPILAVTHTYDRSSNRLTADDARPGAKLPSRNRGFGYDRLHRLVQEVRAPEPDAPYLSQHKSLQWNLDMLGNWNSLVRDADEDGSFTDYEGDNHTDSRTHNAANEIESNGLVSNPNYDREVLSGSSPAVSRFHQHRYDSAGNMTDQRSGNSVPVGTGLMGGLRMGYDAWNRLVKTEHVSLGGGTVLDVSAYTYNALGWRTSKTFDATKSGYDGVMEQKRVFIYDASWRIIEEHTDIDFDDDEGVDWVSQQFWGLRYIDDLVAKRVDRDADGDWTDSDASRWYFITDSQFSVCAVLDSSKNLWERIEYDAYGNARHRYGGDATGDGAFGFGDVVLYTGFPAIGDGGYHADLDLNFDGVTDATDTGIIGGRSGAMSTALPAGWISDPSSDSGPDNSIGYAGYVFNHEREDYTVRFRVYSPELGRWRTRDPAGYTDGMALFEYVQSQPINYVDMLGLQSNAPSCNRNIEGARMTGAVSSGLTILGETGASPKNSETQKMCDAYSDAAKKLGEIADFLLPDLTTPHHPSKGAPNVVTTGAGLLIKYYAECFEVGAQLGELVRKSKAISMGGRLWMGVDVMECHCSTLWGCRWKKIGTEWYICDHSGRAHAADGRDDHESICSQDDSFLRPSNLNSDDGAKMATKCAADATGQTQRNRLYGNK